MIPAWSSDRGNLRTYTDRWADSEPMVAFGGESPAWVEYEIPVPAGGTYRLHLLYAAATARPVDLTIDGKPAGAVCRDATGGWNTSQAKWEDSGEFAWQAGTRVLRFERPGDFPHVVALRLESPALPEGYRPHRPRARGAAAAGLAPALRTDPAARVESLRLAIGDLARTYRERYPQGAAFRARLGEIEKRLHDGSPKQQVEADLDALQRDALHAHPLLDRSRLLALHRGFPDPAAARRAMGAELGVGSLNAHTSDTLPRQNTWRDRFVFLAADGVKPLFTPPAGETLIDPVLHFDARRLLFAMQGQTQKNWRLWEVGIDGGGLRQITPDDGGDVGHFDACYLPDGKVIFASTAVYQGLPCEFGGRQMVCLYRLDPASGAIRQLTFEQDSDWCPTVLDDGRVLYQRWEYTDQSHANSRMLFQMNPDGTGQREFRGSGSWFPGSFFYAKPLPGQSTRVIGIAGGHHGTPRSGRLLILDPSQGRRDAEGIVQEIPFRGREVEPVVRDRLVDGVWPQFLTPMPLDSRHFLVSAKLNPRALWGIYLVDTFDNMTLIHEEEGAAMLWPMIARPVKPPHVIPDRIDPKSDQAKVMISDVHRGPGLDGVPRGTVHKLRVIEYSFSKRGFGGLYGTLGSDGPWDVKRILGTVPVEPDGSAHFTIPANTPLSIQPLDEQGQALQLMRSWFVGMPGETVSCTGCHEPQDEALPPLASSAARHPPVPIQPWHGPARGFSFENEVQPVLDRHCVSCHDGEKANPSLSGGRPLADWSSQMSGQWKEGGKFTESYFELQRFVRRPGIEGDRRMFTPLDYHFRTTELGQVLEKGHHGARLDPESRERLAAWVDFNAPFFGRWSEIPQFRPDAPGGKRLAAVNARADELRRRYVPMGPHPDHEAAPPPPDYDRTPLAPAAPPPAQAAAPACEGWPFDAAQAVAMQQVSGPNRKVTRTIDLGGGTSLELLRIPGGRFVIGSTSGHPDEQPPAVVEAGPFWLARTETTNRQFRAFRPEHDSRTEDRIGYQFGAVGYDLNQPEQPAVRVSWNDALDFCRWLSSRSGLEVSLPDEAQWEWACRAGTDTPYWFGDAAADYSPFANLGDQRLREFAADTSLDNYSAARPMTNPNRYDAWIPRDDRFDDRGFVSLPVASYRPNPWGLHDMHGNVWEWTRSCYRPYPLAGSDDKADAPGARVVRGGSWYDRPHRATSSFRLPYPPWQRVFNVGFRVLCSDSPARATAAHP